MYVVITEDRHVDVAVDLFTSLADAIAHAKLKAKNLVRFIDCYEEVDVKGWLFCAEFACGESDNVHIIENDIKDDEFLTKLKAMCLKYDEENGAFPESEYEGFELYCDALGKRIYYDDYFEDMIP